MRLYLIATTCLQDSYREFLKDRNLTWRESSASSDAERLVEIAGRVCYLSFGDKQSAKTNAEYIANLVAQGHGSVLEHATFTVLADEISRALSHQLVRHRVGFSYSQLSQQYHDDISTDYVIPPELEGEKEAAVEWKAATDAARQAYAALTRQIADSKFGRHLTEKERMRAIRSLARTVLPNATATTLVITGNARAWRHVLSLRGAIAGDPEMRRFSVGCLRLLEPVAPALFDDFKFAKDELGEYVLFDGRLL